MKFLGANGPSTELCFPRPDTLRVLENVLRCSGRVAASLLVGFALFASEAPRAAADQSLSVALEDEESEILRLLERARQREAESIRREDAAEASRASKRERDRREIADRNSALRRERSEVLLRQIDAEIQVEGRMTERQQRNQSAVVRDSLGAHGLRDLASRDLDSSAREAPPAPEIRNLPRAIFSEESVTIAAGTPGFGNKRKIKVTRLSLDADSDGVPEIVRYVDRKTDAWIRQEEDRNYDGVMDAFLRFEDKHLIERNLDSNDDGRVDIHEVYANGHIVSRHLDSNDDGVMDAHYDYQGGFLSQERHDANNDGEIDLVIEYREGRRVSSEEDTSRDGRPDTWIRYTNQGEFETISQIDSDRAGRGFADTFETFDTQSGKSVLAERSEDFDGDGVIDMVSIYRGGKLVRRNILNPEVVPL